MAYDLSSAFSFLFKNRCGSLWRRLWNDLTYKRRGCIARLAYRRLAVAESTPGPIAVNIATFIGSSQAGFFGALLATLGVVLPAFIIILSIAAFAKNLFKREGVAKTIASIRPAISAMVIATALTMLASLFFGFENLESKLSVNYPAMIILASLFAVSFLMQRFTKKKPTPVVVILISAVLGMIFYGI